MINYKKKFPRVWHEIGIKCALDLLEYRAILSGAGYRAPLVGGCYCTLVKQYLGHEPAMVATLQNHCAIGMPYLGDIGEQMQEESWNHMHKEGNSKVMKTRRKKKKKWGGKCEGGRLPIADRGAKYIGEGRRGIAWPSWCWSTPCQSIQTVLR